MNNEYLCDWQDVCSASLVSNSNTSLVPSARQTRLSLPSCKTDVKGLSHEIR
jgi:hypothetical protein